MFFDWVGTLCVHSGRRNLQVYKTCLAFQWYGLGSSVLSRFFDQVGHETMYASSGNKHSFTNKSCHHQTYQNYEQSQQTLGTFLVNKVHNFFRLCS